MTMIIWFVHSSRQKERSPLQYFLFLFLFFLHIRPKLIKTVWRINFTHAAHSRNCRTPNNEEVKSMSIILHSKQTEWHLTMQDCCTNFRPQLLNTGILMWLMQMNLCHSLSYMWEVGPPKSKMSSQQSQNLTITLLVCVKCANNNRIT